LLLDVVAVQLFWQLFHHRVQAKVDRVLTPPAAGNEYINSRSPQRPGVALNSLPRSATATPGPSLAPDWHSNLFAGLIIAEHDYLYLRADHVDHESLTPGDVANVGVRPTLNFEPWVAEVSWARRGWAFRWGHRDDV
jgi:hypothetical protein